MGIKWDANREVASNIFETIGRTPLVRLDKVTEGVKAQILGKMEYFSPTGSLKDRIYYRMITTAIERGELRPGMTIIECSTGNAGISCALVGGVLGYPVIIVMPSEMSEERKKIIRAYGAEIMETPGGETDVDLCTQKVAELKAKEPGKYWEPAQFSNPDNVMAHFTTTGPEIWEQTKGQLHVFVAAQRTGGTLTGVGRYLKEMNPEVKLFGVEPAEAPMLSKGEWGTHSIEGIGNALVSRNMDLAILEGMVIVTSEEAIEMAKRLAVEEGIFCGISSGCNVAAALKLARRYPEAQVIVTMINDSGQRYFSTALCGEAKEIEVPEREHPMDDYTKRELEKHQARLVVIE